MAGVKSPGKNRSYQQDPYEHSKHAGMLDFQNHISLCKCGWKSKACDYIYEALGGLDKHFNKFVLCRQYESVNHFGSVRNLSIS